MSATQALIRHFLGSFVGRGVLEDEGIESVRALFFGIAAMLGTVGIFLPRQFQKIYAGLAHNEAAYQQAILADGFLMLSLPFLLALLVAALVAPAMFPDEVDYITLVPLPLSRRRIFAAKLVALAIFGGSVLMGLTLFTSLAFPGFTHQLSAGVSLPVRIMAHAGASLMAGLLGFGVVVALQGLALIVTPQRWVTRVSITIQCVCVASVLVAVPFAFLMTSERRWIATEPDALFWLPPAWALGVERWLSDLSNPYWSSLAAMGALALVVVAALSIGAYAILYRHAERLILPAPPTARGQVVFRAQYTSGVGQFTRATLVRNRLPLLLFLVFTTAPLGFLGLELAEVTSSLLGGAWFQRTSHLGPATVRFPLVMILVGAVGLRMAFLVPVMSKANWIFRVTDGPDTRRSHLGVVDHAMLRWVVFPALLLGAPFQVAAFGWSAVVSLLLTGMIGAVIVEVALAGWRRVPFTCTWIPGQRPLVFTFLASLIALGLVAGFLPPLVWVATVRSTSVCVVLGGLLLLVAGGLRLWRVRTWADQPLLFEDERYDKVQTLGLSR